ncbi:hypothetical protein Sjap_003417 [Stephania japonica]|uniref:Cytochrome P450 n=1 Tax=Stephania japonica TaxID=461633 RepID=A0AAP0KNQ3_9MAGN
MRKIFVLELMSAKRVHSFWPIRAGENIFLAGVDSSAIVVVWAMADLARKPELMKKAQYEIRTSVGKKGKVEESDIEQLHYLKMRFDISISCPGMTMGMLNAELGLANLLYCFDWELPGGMNAEGIMDEGVGIALHKKSPLLFVPLKFNW